MAQQNEADEAPQGAHIFHQQCIEQWFLKKPECPLCRTSYAEKLQSFVSQKRREQEANRSGENGRNQDRGIRMHDSDDEERNPRALHNQLNRLQRRGISPMMVLLMARHNEIMGNRI